MKNILVTLIVLTVLSISAVSSVGFVNTVSAKTVCTQTYGQPVVCHEEEEKVLGEHVPVETGLKENLAVVGIFMVAISLILRNKKISFLG